MKTYKILVRRYNSRLCAAMCLAILAGCLPEDAADPKPNPNPDPSPPPLPTLLCTPFVKTGYADKVSYLPGEAIRVYFESTQATDPCRLTIFGVAGDSAYSVVSFLPLAPDIPADASENGFDFPVGVQFDAPQLKSGMYLIEKKIPFIIRDQHPVDVLVVYPSNTANAYADSGGRSLYSRENRPPRVSFHRPIPLASLSEVCLKWFSKLPDFSIAYIADTDMDAYESISGAKVIVIAGHSEYWTRQARLNFDRFIDEGGDALILSGNTMWWQVRYSPDRSAMICYKDHDSDPTGDPLLKTINWTEPSLQYPILKSIGAHFPLGGYGRQNDQGWNGYKIATPASPLLDGLNLKKGDIISLPSLEYDGAPLSGYDEEGFPILDRATLNFDNVELVAFDRGFRAVETTATFIVFRKTATSGIIINTSTTDWCSPSGMGGAAGDVIKGITRNALTKLVNDASVFSQ